MGAKRRSTRVDHSIRVIVSCLGPKTEGPLIEETSKLHPSTATAADTSRGTRNERVPKIIVKELDKKKENSVLIWRGHFCSGGLVQ